MVKPIFFASAAEWRAWLETHHLTACEVVVGFHKRGTGQPSITWPESVDAALCVGWIDGVRRSLGERSYTIRFTPRKARSTWSAINIGRVKELTRMGRMHPAGLEAFARRTDDRSAIYAYEQRHGASLDGRFERRLRANKKAWAFFQAQPPWYRRSASHWVVSAKKKETREKRLVTLIQDSAAGRTIPPLTRPPGPKRASA
jgi:uncharacterized protein YdeI (YjbR/CyaY-like superfamily)